MPSPLAVAAAVGVLGLLALAAWRLSEWIAHRRQVSRTVALAAAVKDEPWLSLILDDPTDEIPLAVDPPVVPGYLDQPVKSKDLHRPCIEAYADRRYPDICKTCRPVMGAHR